MTKGKLRRAALQASANTIDWPKNSGGYTEVFYDRAAREIWTVDHVSLGQNNWTEPENPNVVKLCNTEHHLSAREILRMVEEIEEIYSKGNDNGY